MKIFSNFDTQFRDIVVERKRRQFKKDQVLVIQRSRYYLIFRVIFPLSILLGVAAMVYIFFGQYEIIRYVRCPLVVVWLVIVWFQVGHKFLKYSYDFTVVDPLGITTYKQKGILFSQLKEIPANRIRSIQISHSKFLGNIFGFGSIDIHTDFSENMHIGEDTESPSVIGLNYVDHPFKTKNSITDICYT